MGGRRARYIYLLPRTVDANDFGGWGVDALNANNYWDRGVGALNITVGMHILLLYVVGSRLPYIDYVVALLLH